MTLTASRRDIHQLLESSGELVHRAALRLLKLRDDVAILVALSRSRGA